MWIQPHLEVINLLTLNFINLDLGFIVCFVNFKKMDKNEPENRLEWSQLMFEAYKEEAVTEPETL